MAGAGVALIVAAASANESQCMSFPPQTFANATEPAHFTLPDPMPHEAWETYKRRLTSIL
jgi:hypothetical protein